MTPERWRRIEDLFPVAVAQPTAARSAFLEQACANDPDLKREIEALIVQESAGLLEEPPIALAAPPMSDPSRVMRSGRRLGAFEIQSPLGAGGMGEVYRARDTKL